MKTDFSLPGIKLETVNLISKVNNVIKIYSDNSPQNSTKLTEEFIKDIVSQYDGNAYKFLELWRVLILYAVRNNLTDVYRVLTSEFNDIFDTLRPDEVNMAISIVNKTRDDLKNIIIKHTADTDFLFNEFSRIINKIRESVLMKKDMAADELEGVMNLNTNSNIQFSAVIDSLLEMTKEIVDDLILQESIGATARKLKDKATSKIVKYTLKDREISDKLNEKFNRYLDDYKEKKKIDSYDKLVKNTFNLSRLLKNLLLGGLVFIFVQSSAAAGLVAAIITMLVKFALDKRTEDKHKKVILADLKFERTMLQEKIKDAEAKGDKKAKYQLMRIENEVARAIDRITFGLSQK